MTMSKLKWIVSQTAADLGTARVMTADGLQEVCRCSPILAPLIAQAPALRAIAQAVMDAYGREELRGLTVDEINAARAALTATDEPQPRTSGTTT